MKMITLMLTREVKNDRPHADRARGKEAVGQLQCIPHGLTLSRKPLGRHKPQVPIVQQCSNFSSMADIIQYTNHCTNMYQQNCLRSVSPPAQGVLYVYHKSCMPHIQGWVFG
ncbi:MAG: hypothetical protein GY820_35625 [Gammaproteobacteria bacterium]|nr:hypothetical protein [Gammaproteobacteria bacterium]